MTDFIGSVIGMVLVFFILLPAILAIYMLANSKIDVDGDGKEDIPFRWQK